MVKCPYCDKTLREVNRIHLKIHNKTIWELFDEHPEFKNKTQNFTVIKSNYEQLTEATKYDIKQARDYRNKKFKSQKKSVGNNYRISLFF